MEVALFNSGPGYGHDRKLSDCLSGSLQEEAKAIVYALNNDRNQAQKARLEARMATTQINQKIHDIAEARWKMLPIAVQREHDILAMDISELQVKPQSVLKMSSS